MSQSLTIDALTIEAGTARLLDSVSLQIQAGEFVALVGPNGAGKSTLIHAILGLRNITSGSIQVGGQAVGGLSGRERAAQLAWLPQHGQTREPIPVIELLVAARFRFDEGRSIAVKAAEAALASVEASTLRDRSINSLSGGESQRVALAVLRAQEAQFLLLDEPANHLDPVQQLRTYARLGSLWAEGRGLLCVTHDLNLLAAVERPNPDTPIRVVGLRSGQLCFDSHFDSPELPELLSELFQVRFEALSHQGGRHLVVAGEAP